jgi:hypothetical protein
MVLVFSGCYKPVVFHTCFEFLPATMSAYPGEIKCIARRIKVSHIAFFLL